MKPINLIAFLCAIIALCSGDHVRQPHYPPRRTVIFKPLSYRNSQKQPPREQRDITDYILQQGIHKLIDLSSYFIEQNRTRPHNKRGPFLYISSVGPIEPFIYQNDNKIVEFLVDNKRLLDYFDRHHGIVQHVIDNVDPSDKKMQQDIYSGIVQSLKTDHTFTTHLRDKLMARLSRPQQSAMALNQKDIDETFSNAKEIKMIGQQLLNNVL